MSRGPASTPGSRRSSGRTASPGKLGLRELYIKDDSVNHPTLSYKDRVVSMAATRAVELGFTTFGCASTGNLANSVVGARGAARARVLRLHPGRPRARQGARVRRLPAARHRRARQLRRREPAVHADCGSARLGVREHQPAQLLRRRREDARVRGRRAARLALPAAPGLAGRRRHAAAAHRTWFRGAAADRPGRWRAAAHPRGAGGGVRAGDSRSRGGAGVPGSGQAEDDRQVDRDRESCRRIPGASRRSSRPAVRRRGVDRRGDPAGDGSARRDRRHLHRTGRWRHACRCDGARSSAA